MKFLSVISLCFLLCLCVHSVLSQNANTPPRGWNSYDSFSWIITEEQYLQNAQIISDQLLSQYGYEYAVVDYLWYRSLSGGSNSRGNDCIDEWGRMHPDAKRWPSSVGWNGFKNVADKVHGMGLKFGIHLMAGISTQAYDANTPILDTTTGKAYEESGKVWHAKDIGIPERACKWMDKGFMALNVTSGAGKAFLKSLYQLYTSWGLDFVKLDCVFGEDLDFDEITYVSQILKDNKSPIVFSLSPGVGATPDMAKKINGVVNTYRVTGDDWDQWSQVVSHFDVARDFAAANLIGAQGLNGKSWPDLDMLPFGWLTDPADNEGPHRLTNLNLVEQQTQMTLWCMAKSPIIYGGDLRNLDSWTKDGVIINPTLLFINSNSSNNTEACESFLLLLGRIFFSSIVAEGSSNGIRAWIATGNNGGQTPQGRISTLLFSI
ncbi:putative alpha-galactosidase [Lupinus albus]|uniref:Alpha-galactosidase n=1 Tax=Lupinus albus TaxID=3870 RepID=A0A6A4QN92_LUPAL|nr:putative alpha-galactosidase [Lupinus albus]